MGDYWKKKEIKSALEIAKFQKLDCKIMDMFDQSKILNIINKNRWDQGCSKNQGTFMTEDEFQRILRKKNKTFFVATGKVGLKAKIMN